MSEAIKVLIPIIFGLIMVFGAFFVKKNPDNTLSKNR